MVFKSNRLEENLIETVTWDFEVTTKHKGAPFTASNKSVSYAVKRDDNETTFHYYTDLEYTKALKEAFMGAKLLVGFNAKYDWHWARKHGLELPEGVRIWDCQIAEFLLRGQQGSYPSLDEALARFDLGAKDDKIAEYWKLGVDTIDIPVDELRVYNILDVDLTYKLYLKQQEEMPEKLKKLCMVMGLDLLVLAEMEWNGVKLDVELCKQKAEQTAKELKEVSDELLTFSPTPYINLDSGHQLSCLLYGGGFEITLVDRVERKVYQSGKRKGEEYDKTHWKTEVLVCDGYFTPIRNTETKLKSKADGKEYTVYATGEDVLKQLRTPTKKHRRIIELLLLRAEKEKLLNTYYGALPQLISEMEWQDNLLHGQLNQTVARTGRLSSSNPNMQNFSSEVDEVLISRYD